MVLSLQFVLALCVVEFWMAFHVELLPLLRLGCLASHMLLVLLAFLADFAQTPFLMDTLRACIACDNLWNDILVKPVDCLPFLFSFSSMCGNVIVPCDCVCMLHPMWLGSFQMGCSLRCLSAVLVHCMCCSCSCNSLHDACICMLVHLWMLFCGTLSMWFLCHISHNTLVSYFVESVCHLVVVFSGTR